MVKQRMFDGNTSKKSLLAAERAQELCLTKQRSFGLDISKNQTDLAGKSLQKATATNSQGTSEQWRHAEHGHYSLFLSKAREIIKLSTITSSPITTKYTHYRIVFWIKIMYLFENKAWFFFLRKWQRTKCTRPNFLINEIYYGKKSPIIAFSGERSLLLRKRLIEQY